MNKQRCINKNGERMFSMVDFASLSVILASFAVVIYNIRLELKAKA